MVIKDNAVGMSMDEFARIYEEEGPFEFVDGEKIIASPSVFGPVHFANKIMLLVNGHSIPKQLGEAFIEAPFVITSADDPNWVKGSRVPDVSFVRAERLSAYKAANADWENKPLALVPDLAIEIVSPTDRYVDVSKKVTKYLQDGVQIVLVVEPQNRTIAVHTAKNKQHILLLGDDILNLGDILPGFEVALNEIFS